MKYKNGKFVRSSFFFFSDFKDTVQWWGQAMVEPGKPAMASLQHLLRHLLTGVTSFSAHLPGKETEAKGAWSLSGDHSSKGRGVAEISKSPLVLGCDTRGSRSADVYLDFFRAKSRAGDRKDKEIQRRLPSPPLFSTSSLSLTPSLPS